MSSRLLPEQGSCGSNKTVCDMEIEGNIQSWIKKTLRIQSKQKTKEIFPQIIPDVILDRNGHTWWVEDKESWVRDPDENNAVETLSSYVYLQRTGESDKELSRIQRKRVEKDVDFILTVLLSIHLLSTIYRICLLFA
jgi:hypothetical protein